jgi:hypothetical protein
MTGGGQPFAALRSALGPSESAKRWATLHVPITEDCGFTDEQMPRPQVQRGLVRRGRPLRGRARAWRSRVLRRPRHDLGRARCARSHARPVVRPTPTTASWRGQTILAGQCSRRYGRAAQHTFPAARPAAACHRGRGSQPQGEAVNSPSPPFGRLSGHQETLNVIRHHSNSYKQHQCASSAFFQHAESNHHCLHPAARHSVRRLAEPVNVLVAARDMLRREGSSVVQQPLLPGRDRHVRRMLALAMIRRSWNDVRRHAVEVLHVSGVARRVRTALPYASHGGRFGLRRHSGQRRRRFGNPHGGSPRDERQASVISNRRLSKTARRTQICSRVAHRNGAASLGGDNSCHDARDGHALRRRIGW